MYEKKPSLTNKETILDRNIGVTTVSQMDQIRDLPELAHLASDGSFSEDDSLALANWTRENEDNLKETLKELGYYEEDGELTEANLTRLRLCLLTPRFFYAQERKDQSNDKSVMGELIEYNGALQEMVLANPDMDMDELSHVLHGAAMWAELPETRRHSRSDIAERVINGARGELVMRQLLNTKAAKMAGIVSEPASAEDDARGIDLNLTVPIYKGQPIDVTMGVDVKFDRRQILNKLRGDAPYQPYIIMDGKVVFWPNVTKDEMGNRLMLKPSVAEKKGELVVPMLQRIAEEFQSNIRQHQRIRKVIGSRALDDYGIRSA